MNINIDELVAELGQLTDHVGTLTANLASVPDPQATVNSMPLADCHRISNAIRSLRSALGPILDPNTQTFSHALQDRMFYVEEAKWWLRLINEIVNEEIDFSEFDSELVTFKNRDIALKIEPNMITQVVLAISENYEYNDEGGTYTTYHLQYSSTINWNVLEMHPIIHQCFEFHTDDEEAINEIIDTILDTLNEQIIEHIIDDLDIDDVINIDDWLDKTRSLDEITIPIEYTLSNP